jgi:tetratricopeptide (TPR) repeat protein
MILAQSTDREAEALEYGRKAATRLEALLATGASPADAAAGARVYVNLALAHANMHHLDQAADYARRSVEISRLAGDPRQLSRALSVFANTARFAGDLDAALRAARESRTIAENTADSDNTDSMFVLSSVLWREGLILGELNNISFDRPGESEPLLRRAFDIAEALARKDPQDYTSRSYVSMTGRELGDVLRTQDPAGALAVYDRTLHRLAEVKNNSKVRRDEVWPLTGSSYALRRLGRVEESRRRIDTALANLRNLGAYPPAKIEIGEETDAALRALADHYADIGQVAAAIQTYEELHAKIQASRPRPAADLRHANGLSRLYRDLANLHARAGRLALARALQQRRLDLWQQWNERMPHNPFVQRQLSAAQM